MKGSGTKFTGVKHMLKIKRVYEETKREDGEILVTFMTSPDFMSAIRRCAAIISRELKIPCIVGTKVATEVLKAFDKLGVEKVAVRSSAVVEDSSNASWAGQLETYLNISREDLINKL